MDIKVITEGQADITDTQVQNATEPVASGHTFSWHLA
jgi:hypothetical protein